MLMNEPQWVAVYTNPRYEKRVEQTLREKGFEVYLPLRRELHKWSDRKKWVEVPLIKSYVFVRIADRQVMQLRQTAGVSHIIQFEGKIATIPDFEIQLMKDFLAAELDVQVRTSELLHVGRTVRVVGGALEGKLGTLVSDCEDGNFAVEITGISMAMIVHIDAEMLEIVEEEEVPKPTGRKHKYNIR